MRCYTTLILSIFSFALSAQTTYKCTYADTMTIRIPPNMSFNFSGNLPDSIQQKMSAAMTKKLSMQPFVQLNDRMVLATADSTLIVLNNSNTIDGGINMNLPFHKMLIRGGKVLGVYDVDGNKKSNPEYEAPAFVATGRKQMILKYECEAFTSGPITIWVTAALPSAINPGINRPGVVGAILAFENESEHVTQVSKVQAINQGN